MTESHLTDPSSSLEEFRPLIYRNSDDRALSEIRERNTIRIFDRRDLFAQELAKLQPPLESTESTESNESPESPESSESPESNEGDRWVFFPWRDALVHLPGPSAFRRLRTDRNRNKITSAEQEGFSTLKIGVVGLSVGHSIAHTLALERLCGELRLADFDTIELSNLNRIPATVFDIGVNKAVVAARRIAELDPYLDVRVYSDGLTEASMSGFFDGLDLVIEECDSLDMKVRIREEARRRGLPLLMETSDRGLFDVERFDQEPDRRLFHGLLGDVDPRTLTGLKTRDKAPHVMRILQATQLSARMAASMVEIDRTLSTWPQLGGDIALGSAMVAAAVRRFGRDQHLPSGRIRVDLEESLDLLDPAIDEHPTPQVETLVVDLTAEIPVGAMDAVIHSIRLAPSGGNIQPWSVRASKSSVAICLVRDRSTAMDHDFRGTYVAIGAASFNARVAAASHGRSADVAWLPIDAGPDVAVTIDLTGVSGHEPELAAQYPAMVRRISNRSIGRRADLGPRVKAELRAAAEAEGAVLHVIDEQAPLARLADILAESDRLRYLTPILHEEMMSELKWPGQDRLDVGIDVRTLGLDEADLAKLEVARRPEVMRNLAAWNGGSALGDDTRDRVNSSSALVVVTGRGDAPLDYLRGGAAVERVWITAEQLHLGVQPVSPVFLYARGEGDFRAISAPFHQELSELRDRFTAVIGLETREAPMLVLRMSHDPGRAVRSERLPLAEVLMS